MHKRLTRIITAGVLFSLHMALLVYINAVFLSQFLSPVGISIVYTIGSLLSLAFMLSVPLGVRRYGAMRMLLGIFFLIDVLLLFLSAHTIGPLVAVTCFVLYFASAFLAIPIIDTLIERETPILTIGHVRGLYLALVSSATLVGPSIGSLLSRTSIEKVYALASIAVAGAFICLGLGIGDKDATDNITAEIPSWKNALSRVFHARHLLKIFFAEFGIQFFYGVMTISLVEYLHITNALSFETISVILFVMLLPFVLFEYPIGVLCDKFRLEDKLVTYGFFVMGCAVALMTAVSHGNIYVLMVTLFLSRIGASMVETGTETHFFRHVKQESVGVVSFFRALIPIGFLVGSLFCALLVSHGQAVVFVALSIAMVLIGCILQTAPFKKGTP